MHKISELKWFGRWGCIQVYKMEGSTFIGLKIIPLHPLERGYPLWITPYLVDDKIVQSII